MNSPCRCRVVSLLAVLCVVSFCSSARLLRAAEDEFAVGADLSSVAQAEQSGIVFKDDGQPKPALQLFKDHRYNWIRLRLFHTPTGLPNNLEYTLALGQASQSAGL